MPVNHNVLGAAVSRQSSGMEQFRGHAVRVEHVVVGGRGYDLLAPAKGEALLDDPRVIKRFERDEYMPYWAILWPAALLLAEAVARWPRVLHTGSPPGVLELGCGLGLVGLVAAARGYRVTVSDHDRDALAFTQENALRNGLPVPAARPIDWRGDDDCLQVDRVLAADVLYEGRNLRPVADSIRRHLKSDGFALVSDPNRQTANAFDAVAREQGLTATVEPAEIATAPNALPIRGRIFRLVHRRRRIRTD